MTEVAVMGAAGSRAVQSRRRWAGLAFLVAVVVGSALWFVMKPSSEVPKPATSLETGAAASREKPSEVEAPTRRTGAPTFDRAAMAAAVEAPSGATAKVLGPHRILSGWVLDVHKQPVANAVVSASALTEIDQPVGAATTLRTGPDGAFSIPASLADARILATGPNGAMAAVNIKAGDTPRADIVLVVVDSGTITVHVADERMRGMPVMITSYDPGIFGPLDSGLDDLVDDLAIDGEDLERAAPPEPTLFDDTARVIGLVNRLEDGLRSWESGDPEGSLVRIGLLMFQAEPELETLIRKDLPPELAHLADFDTPSMVTEMVRLGLKEEPMIAAVVEAVADQLKSEPDTRLASLFENGGLETYFAESVARAVADSETVAEEVMATPGMEAVPAEAMGLDDSADLGAEDDGEPVEWTAEDFAPRHGEELTGDVAATPLMEAFSRIQARFGDAVVMQGPSDAATILAHGRVSEPIFVRGGHRYGVSLGTGDNGVEIDCGVVRVGLGQAVELTCGAPGRATVFGRVVDSAGRPVVGAEVVPAARSYREADGMSVSGADGRFELHVTVALATPTRLQIRWVDAAGEEHHGRVQSVNMAGGVEIDVGDVVVRSVEERAAFGLGVDDAELWGAALSEGNDGIVVTDVESNMEIGQFGVSRGDTLVQWGDFDLAEVSLDDLVMRLQPTADGVVENDFGDIIVRTWDGDLYTIDPTVFANPLFGNDE